MNTHPWINIQELCTILVALVICFCTTLHIVCGYFWRNRKRDGHKQNVKKTDHQQNVKKMGHKQNVKKTGHKQNLKKTDKQGNTPLMRAVSAGDVELIKCLVQQGTDVNAVNNDHKTALLLASRSDDVNVLKIFIEAGADVNYVQPFSRQTALYHA